jgi:hypothetical protein
MPWRIGAGYGFPDVPKRFDLVFKADGTNIPCHVIWRQAEQISVAFD